MTHSTFLPQIGLLKCVVIAHLHWNKFYWGVYTSKFPGSSYLKVARFEYCKFSTTINFRHLKIKHINHWHGLWFWIEQVSTRISCPIIWGKIWSSIQYEPKLTNLYHTYFFNSTLVGLYLTSYLELVCHLRYSWWKMVASLSLLTTLQILKWFKCCLLHWVWHWLSALFYFLWQNSRPPKSMALYL